MTVGLVHHHQQQLQMVMMMEILCQLSSQKKSVAASTVADAASKSRQLPDIPRNKIALSAPLRDEDDEKVGKKKGGGASQIGTKKAPAA